MPTRSPQYGLRLPISGESPDMPQAMEDFTADLEPLLATQEEKTNGAVSQAQQAVESAQASETLVEMVAQGSEQKVSSLDSSYAIAFADGQGYEAGGFTKAAVFDTQKPITYRGASGITLVPVDSPDYAFAVVDQAGALALGIKHDGSLELGNAAASISEWEAMTRSTNEYILTYGDSLTHGHFDGTPGHLEESWAAKLDSLTASSVINSAFSGFTVDEQGLRSGFFQPALEVVGGVIPGSGAVQVTSAEFIGWGWKDRTTRVEGALAGVEGVLSHDAAGTLRFTRDIAGSPVTVSGAVPWVGKFNGYQPNIIICFIGRNDISRNVTGPSGSVPSHVLAGVKRIEAGMTPDIKKLMVISVTNQTSEVRGTQGYATVAETNQRLKAAYPNRFFDLRSWLVHDAIYELGVTPTEEDTKAMAGDAPPPSVMDLLPSGARDPVHYSRETAALIGEHIFTWLKERDWIK